MMYERLTQQNENNKLKLHTHTQSGKSIHTRSHRITDDSNLEQNRTLNQFTYSTW